MKFGDTAGYRQVGDSRGGLSGGFLDSVIKRRSGYRCFLGICLLQSNPPPHTEGGTSRHRTMCRGSDGLHRRGREKDSCLSSPARISSKETKKSHDHHVSGGWCGFGGGSRFA
ncbi:uncharacterized protein PgNI_02434 [Pyricularia grisea]|uniref:Uncharacterized protein n=1 Tax=Pyricularia grisea TaxID=148305 RepID=A0A6P8BI12_PYRGI|nr:uncharacterized protein PgNI_02434 [Pyricularia grisea]TLD16259.1 hypothetical protein PgNI_02434 [Pyricularia grisea]